METNLNVNMTGKEYIEYRKSKKFKLSKRGKKALPYFILCLLGIFLIIFLVDDLTYKPTKTFIDVWYESIPQIATLSWNSIAKVTLLFFGPFLIIMIGLSWLFHGVGFFIVRG